MSLVLVISSIIGFVILAGIDFLYLTYTKDNLYKPIIDPKETINIPCVILCWMLIIFGIQFLVINRPDISDGSFFLGQNALLYGAILGMTSYGLYNLTNFATYPSKWSVTIAICDTLWGTFITAIISLIVYKTYFYVNK